MSAVMLPVPRADNRNRRYSDGELIAMAQLDVMRLGRMPFQREWEEAPDRPCPDVPARRFGSWAEMARRIGQTAERSRAVVERWPSDLLLALVREDSERIGRPPTCSEWDTRADRPGASTAQRHFGSWNEMLKAAGFEPRKQEDGPRLARVPNAPLREAFLASGKSAAEVARALDWYASSRRRGKPYRHADGHRVLRALGLRAYNSQGFRTTRTHVGEERAAELARAIGVAPHEVGI